MAGRQALFLLDGLDEVGEEGVRLRVSAAVQELARRVAGCPVVVTSRPAG